MRLLYLNSENLYTQDTHLIQGFRELGHEVIEIAEKKESFSYSRLISRLRSEWRQGDVVIVGYPSPLLAIRAKLSTRLPIIFNAVSSQWEANVVSRGEIGFLGWKALKSYAIDFISFHLSSRILLESNAQIEYASRLFLVPKSKCVLSYSGIDERDFFYDASVQKRPDFTVLFRGRFLPESGILTVIEAAKRLEDSEIRFLVIGHGFMYRKVNALLVELAPRNLEHIHDRLPAHELRRRMLECHISLGQLARHPRLDRTLPCKLFESIALKLPYLTGRNKAIFEVLEENVTCAAVEPASADELVAKIIALKENPDTCERLAAAGYDLYKSRLTSKKLAEGVFTAITKTA
ncbi:MAG TPA: glycosyltransferase [Candidatus Paceibacterota bacterium]|nr:glycosyltransferase [Candidatus Paceibacterota bacterium]